MQYACSHEAFLALLTRAGNSGRPGPNGPARIGPGLNGPGPLRPGPPFTPLFAKPGPHAIGLGPGPLFF